MQYLEDEEQMHKLYWQRAQAYRAAQQYPQAERTLLAIRRWDAAAEMYKAAAMYTDYLRLMKQSPDNLASAQLWVAQQLEAEGHQRYKVPTSAREYHIADVDNGLPGASLCLKSLVLCMQGVALQYRTLHPEMALGCI